MLFMKYVSVINRHVKLFKDKDTVLMMLAAVVHVTEIEFEEDSQGTATPKDKTHFNHGL